MKAGSQGRFLAVLALSITTDDATGAVRWRPEMRQVTTAGVAPEPALAALIKGFTDRLDAELGAPLGRTAVALDTRRAAVRGRETAFGNMLADAMRQAAGADTAIMNGGGIRGDRLYEPGAVLSRKDVLAELPFGNQLTKLDLSGAALLAALEHGLSLVEESAGRFLQVSGLRLTYDPALPPGRRVVALSVAGRPLDPEATYTLATNEYLAAGGDGFDMLAGADSPVYRYAVRPLTDVIIDYITAKGTVAPQLERRIVARTGSPESP
jgi:2',3'-cyclic-nucleotide 2'-phosphodiesterase (5'-nucleotidase family)